MSGRWQACSQHHHQHLPSAPGLSSCVQVPETLSRAYALNTLVAIPPAALDNNACSAILERRLQSVLSSASRKSNSQAGRTLPKSIVDALLDEKAKEVAEMEQQIGTLTERNEEKDGKIARRDRALVETLAKLETAEGRVRELEKRAADPVELLAEVRSYLFKL